MTTLAIFSDLHQEFGAYMDPIPDADVLVLPGDIHRKGHGVAWAASVAAGRPVVYVVGNHECYGEKIPRFHEKLAAEGAPHGVHVLERTSVVLGGVRFLGATLWTDFALTGDRVQAMAAAAHRDTGMNDYAKIRTSTPPYRKLAPLHTAAMHRATVEWLSAMFRTPFAGPTVVVTHHAPTALGCDPATLADPLTPAYASHLDALVAESGAALWVHGHTHWAHDSRIRDTRVLSNPRGYAAIGELAAGFRPDLVVAV